MGPTSLGNRQAAPGRRAIVCWILCLVLAGCATPQPTPEQRAQAARTLYDFTSREYHIPSASARGADQARLEDLAIKGYQSLLRKYPEQSTWAASALRNLGNLYSGRTNVNLAVQHYAAVAERYPYQDGEILMSWKSAADLLWQRGRTEEARVLYGKIVERFDRPNMPQMVVIVVRGSQSRLQTPAPTGSVPSSTPPQ